MSKLDSQEVFVSVLDEGPSSLPFHFGNVDQRLANDVGQVVQASLESISRVCVFAPNYAKMALLYQYWMAAQLFGGVRIFRQPKGDRWTAGKQFDDQLRQFNEESEIRKAVLLTCYSGKMSELAQKTYSCSEVVVFVGVQYYEHGYRDGAVKILKETINTCLANAPNNNRAFVLLETEIFDHLHLLPEQVRDATLVKFDEFRRQIKEVLSEP